ncbi:MAG: BlaI/MecI/CopY family transcriptional regulator [Fuerstiella sp.]
MQKRKPTIRPSTGDMELLSLLWEHGPISLSAAHEQMPEGVAYTTVQTRLNRMVVKGLATREKVGRQPMQYKAAIGPEEINARQLDSLVERVAGGSVLPLVAQLVQKTDFTESELSKLKQLVHEAERRSRRSPASEGED